jgi:hypothetical protein
MALDLQIPIINYPGANSNQISQYILEKIPFDNITKIVSFIGFDYVAEKISQILLNDKHDLIHKAVGWMLREAGRKDEDLLKEYLWRRKSEMSRTTLRYAIEKFPEKERKSFLA